VWVIEPLVPVTVAVSVCAVGELHDRTEVWETPSVMLDGVRVHVRPPVVVTVSVTVPVKPCRGATVIVDVAAAPAFVVTDVGLAVTVKSFTVTVTVAVFVVLPLVPVTVTV
jgi:hypothetical protein